METEALVNIKQQIEARTGLRIRDQDLGKFREIVVARIKHHRLASPEDYQRLLRDHAAPVGRNGRNYPLRSPSGRAISFGIKGNSRC